MSDAIVTTLSTIFGAMIGAAVSWIIARQASRETLRRDQEERREKKLELIFQAFVKLKTIIDSLGTLDGMFTRALSSGHPDAPPWTLIEPLIGSAHEHQTFFDAAEIALFVEAGAPKIAEDLQLLARQHATAGIVIAEYNARRIALAEKMPPPEIIEGTHATSALSPHQRQLVERDMVALDSLLTQLLPSIKEDFALGIALASNFGPTLRKHFADNRIPQFRLPD